jgi:hypothetical protein
MAAAACGPAIAPGGPSEPMESCPVGPDDSNFEESPREAPATGASDEPGKRTAPASDPDAKEPAVSAEPGRSHPLSDADAAERARGIAAMDEGKFAEARQILDAVVKRNPGNLATATLFLTASAALQKSQANAGFDLTNAVARQLPRPPFERSLRAKIPGIDEKKPPRLYKVSETRNQVTDDEIWFRKHDLSLPSLQVPVPERGIAGNVPENIPLLYGDNRMVAAIAHPDHTVVLYGPDYGGGRFVAVFDEKRTLLAFFDFRKYILPPEFAAADAGFVEEMVRWAEVLDGVLYVSNGHRTYASSSKGKNAYLTALDLETGELLWRSAPLVSNAANFLVRDNVIISGYGFSAEPDYLYILDRLTGKTLKRIKLKTGPEYIIEKNDKLFVRTYDMDYVFELR